MYIIRSFHDSKQSKDKNMTATIYFLLLGMELPTVSDSQTMFL